MFAARSASRWCVTSSDCEGDRFEAVRSAPHESTGILAAGPPTAVMVSTGPRANRHRSFTIRLTLRNPVPDSSQKYTPGPTRLSSWALPSHVTS